MSYIEDNKNINSEDRLSEKELNSLFQKFIKDNPELILNTVQEYQNKLIKKEAANKKITSIGLISRLDEVKSNMFMGSNESKKEIFVFVDYNCGYCLQLNNELLKLVDLNSDIKVHTIQLPLLSNTSFDFAKIVIASSIQGDFQKVHNYLFSKQRRSDMAEIFADLFLMDIDIRSIKENITSDQVKKILSKHEEISSLFKFRGTPAIIIGDEIIPGYIELARIKEIINEQFPNAT